jgi:hypothetical protein
MDLGRVSDHVRAIWATNERDRDMGGVSRGKSAKSDVEMSASSIERCEQTQGFD